MTASKSKRPLSSSISFYLPLSSFISLLLSSFIFCKVKLFLPLCPTLLPFFFAAHAFLCAIAHFCAEAHGQGSTQRKPFLRIISEISVWHASCHSEGMKQILFTLLLFVPGRAWSMPTDTLQLSLAEAVRMAQEQSADALAARHTLESAEWSFRYHKANYLPSVSLSSSPMLNRQVSRITQPDGTNVFVRQNQLSTDRHQSERLVHGRHALRAQQPLPPG